MKRRYVLQALGAGLGTSLAGCLDQGGPARQPTETTTDRSGGDGDTATDETTTDDPDGDDDTPTDRDETTTDDPAALEIVGTATTHFATTSSRPDWAVDSEHAVGEVIVIDSRERAEAVLWPHEEVAPDRRETVADFLAATNFKEDVLIFVESVGRNLCYDAISIDDVGLEDDAITATATVTDTSEGDVGCAQAIVYPSTLLRASFAGQRATEAAITVVDGWGTEERITASSTESLAPDPDDLAGFVRPDGDPGTVPAGLSCDRDGLTRVTSWVTEDAIVWGDRTDEGEPTWALRVDRLEAELGETVTVSLTNVADRSQGTGNRHKYSIERYTEDGWQDVRVRPVDRPLEYTDEAILHRPGEGFTWDLELTAEALFADHVHGEHTPVCPELAAGRYRFVFYEPAIAVAFDVVA